MKFVQRAGVWETRTSSSEPCAHCGGPGGHVYLLERTDEPGEAFCDVHCWGRWWDQHVQLTSELPERDEPDIPWQPLTWKRAQNSWGATNPDEPGITRHTTRTGRYLIYRSIEGDLLGLIRITPKGTLFVFVDPDQRGQGIGKALERAAGREWGIDNALQRPTADGRRLSNRTHPGRKP